MKSTTIFIMIIVLATNFYRRKFMLMVWVTMKPLKCMSGTRLLNEIYFSKFMPNWIKTYFTIWLWIKKFL